MELNEIDIQAYSRHDVEYFYNKLRQTGNFPLLRQQAIYLNPRTGIIIIDNDASESQSFIDETCNQINSIIKDDTRYEIDGYPAHQDAF